MNDKVISAEQAEAAEAWLLPEMNAARVVGGSAEVGRAAGFGQVVRPQAKKSGMRLAMTQGDLEALEAEVRANAEQQGRAEGYEQGYKEGEASALRQGEVHSEKVRATLTQLIESLMDPLAGQLESYKRLLSELVIDSAEKICQRELSIDASSIEDVVKQAILAIPMGEQHVVLKVSAEDLRVLQSLPQFLQPGWRMEADSSLSAGDCLIESEHSQIDFGRNARLQQILNDGLDAVIPIASSDDAGFGSGPSTDTAEDSSPGP